MIVFPDAEGLLVDHLRDALSVPVSTKVPNPRPDTFVRLSRVGGLRRDFFTDSPMVVFEAWGATEVIAHDLGSEARSRVYALAGELLGETQVYAVREVGGLQAYPDPATESPRYQFTASLDLRGTEIP